MAQTRRNANYASDEPESSKKGVDRDDVFATTGAACGPTLIVDLSELTGR